MVSLLWNTSRPLAATGLMMLAALGVFVIGTMVDPRTISGAPAWLKPAKFAASIAVYTFTLAWVFSRIPEWTRTRRFVGWTTAVVMVLEMALIGLQAFRGTTSHFNVATVFDGAVMSVMGLAILVQTLASVAVAVALWRQQMEDRALGWALRLGMTITIVGAMTGGMMTQPTQQQLERAYAGERMSIVGAHTVGAADGGPGLPGTGWSREYGDLRIPHFVGLHALQFLPLVSLVLARRRVSEQTRVRLAIVAAASYVGLYGILLSQALRGQSIVAPDVVTVVLLVLWAIGSAAGVLIAVTSSAHTARHREHNFRRMVRQTCKSATFQKDPSHERNFLHPHRGRDDDQASETARVRRMREDRLQLGASAHVSGVRPNALLRQLPEPARYEARPG